MGLLLFGFFFVLSLVVGQRFKSKFRKYSAQPLRAGLTGREVAEQMLHDNNIHDVKVVAAQGRLTDHYNPATKTVTLSPEVYQGQSVASAAVAAHECGHAIQHATSYSMLQLRSTLVPITNASSTIMNVIILGSMFFGFFVYSIFPIQSILLILIASQLILTVFSLITLPVEFDASNRAMAWLNNRNVVSSMESENAKDALKWAAMTYVVAALASLATLMYYVSIFLGSRD